MEARGVVVVLVGVRNDLRGALRRSGILARLGPKQVFFEQAVRHTSTQQGVQYAYELIDEPCENCPRRHGTARSPVLRYDI